MTSTRNQINRRTFIVRSASCLGLTALSPIDVFGGEATARENRKTLKKLFATTDYFGNIFKYQSFMDEAQLDDLHRILASLGVTRHEWLFDTTEGFYENYPHGFDLLAKAVQSAHAHGIEFFAVIKPFEDGGYPPLLPLTMPFPEGAVAFKDMRGICPVARPFASQHPCTSLQRRPGTAECRGPVKAIRLVKSNDQPTRINAEHLSIWTSSSNNDFQRYQGPVSFRESIEWRFRFPKWRQCRILAFEGLEIPREHGYILVRCSLADPGGDFSNENGNIIELVGPDEKILPHTLSSGPISWEDHKNFYHSELMKQLFRYLQLPEVQAEIRNTDKMHEHYQDYFSFYESDLELRDWTTLDQAGYVAAACGKPEYMLGNLHPIYPEVREHWLDLTRYCLDRGVDGIHFRVANHTRSPEYWDYGFNEPVLEAANGKTDTATISRINGDAYTTFLRQARELVKSRGKTMGIHLNPLMIRPDDRDRPPALPPNFEWQWQIWVREIADEFEFRGGYMQRPWNLKKVLDIFSHATQAVNKPLYYQSDFHSMTNMEGRLQRRKEEIDLVKEYPGLDGYVLYTTNNYTKINENREIELLPFMEKAIKTHYTSE